MGVLIFFIIGLILVLLFQCIRQYNNMLDDFKPSTTLKPKEYSEEDKKKVIDALNEVIKEYDLRIVFNDDRSYRSLLIYKISNSGFICYCHYDELENIINDLVETS